MMPLKRASMGTARSMGTKASGKSPVRAKAKVDSFQERVLPKNFSTNVAFGKKMPFTFGAKNGRAFIKPTPKRKG
jgi:hypothetical protein